MSLLFSIQDPEDAEGLSFYSTVDSDNKINIKNYNLCRSYYFLNAVLDVSYIVLESF